MPASLHCEELNDAIDFDGLNVRVAREAGDAFPWRERRLAGINSFGFGGANAHIVIADPLADAATAAAAPAKRCFSPAPTRLTA